MPSSDRAVEALARSTTLDAFIRCQTPAGGCEWRVQLPATLCPRHGGPESAPRYFTDTDGAIIDFSHIPCQVDEP